MRLNGKDDQEDDWSKAAAPRTQLLADILRDVGRGNGAAETAHQGPDSVHYWY